MATRGDGYDQLMSLWAIQESLLQAYRGIFITAESIVFAVAAAITSTNPLSALLLTMLGGVLLYMWRTVTSNRAKDVSFVQWLLAMAEEGEHIPIPLKLLKEFQGGAVITVGSRTVWRHKAKDAEGKVNDEAFINFTKSPTRGWMEKRLPAFFGALWIMVASLAVYALCKTTV